MARKKRTKRRKSATVKRKSKPRKPMARRRRTTKRRSRSTGGRVTRARKSLGGIFRGGIVGKVALGVGAGVTTGLVMDRVAPQFSNIASIGAGFLAGGPIGGVATLLLKGGLSALNFGGSSNGGQSV